MFFHIPPSIQWEPVPLCAELNRREIDATVVRSEIHLTFSSESCDQLRRRHANRIVRRRKLLNGKEGPQVSIRYFPDRFIRNLELLRDPFTVPSTEPGLLAVKGAISEMGGIYLASAETECEIAHQHSSNHAAIADFRCEIERLEEKKQEYIEQQNFQAAADTRDVEDGVRAQLDTMLFHGG